MEKQETTVFAVKLCACVFCHVTLLEVRKQDKFMAKLKLL